jgi:hypothetical protein
VSNVSKLSNFSKLLSFSKLWNNIPSIYWPRLSGDYEPRFFLFHPVWEVFTKIWRNYWQKFWNLTIYQAMARFHGLPYKIESHHKKVAFLGVRIPLESWKKTENTQFGKRFGARRGNSSREKFQTAIENNREVVAAGSAQIWHPGGPRFAYWSEKNFLETKISKCNLTLNPPVAIVKFCQNSNFVKIIKFFQIF